MTKVVITFRQVPNLRMSRLRAVGFLEGHGNLNAATMYEALEAEDKRHINEHIERWAAGHDKPKRWFHGFPNDPKHKECFVFKYQEHRFYGFLCNPCPQSLRRFRLCVLAIYEEKYEWETDDSVLPRIEGWKITPASRAAIAFVYPEIKEQGAAWKN